MRTKERQHQVEGLFVLVVFALFAGSLLMVLLLGAGTYQRITQRDTTSFVPNTTLQYIAAKVHRVDQVGAVHVGSFSDQEKAPGHGISTLYLRQTWDDTWYETRIYYYDGYVRELLGEEAGSFSPQDGNPILESSGLRFQAVGSMLHVYLMEEDGQEQELLLHVRSDQEVGG